MEAIDQLKLNFSPNSLFILYVVLGLVMFGVALDLKVNDFKRLLREPKGPIVGLIGQFVILPWATLALTLIIDPLPSIALGMIVVASCPGGNVSNFITHLAGGRTVLSVTMTAISTVVAIFMTPLNISLLGSLNPKTAAILTEISLDPVRLVLTVTGILIVPLVIGMVIGARYPQFTLKVRKPMKIFSILCFVGFIAVAMQKNWDYFISYVGAVALVVALHNASALGLGYFAARLAGLGERERRAVSIEVGIQNSGLGLVLIFDFFNGLGGMAIIAAWWGVWHIISGLTLAAIWSRRKVPEPAPAASDTA